uniref:Uncharacterized LOC101243435 n=1 Tax=Ciona intestinalis TaxID=7719 RepID=H2XSE8_CIOIN
MVQKARRCYHFGAHVSFGKILIGHCPTRWSLTGCPYSQPVKQITHSRTLQQ